MEYLDHLLSLDLIKTELAKASLKREAFFVGSKKVFLAVLGVLLIAISFSMESKSQQIETQNEFLRPPKSVLYFTLGYNDVIADSYWIRVIQDFGICEKPRKQVIRNDPANLDNIVSDPNSISTCPDSWVSSMVDMILSLSPKFEFAYMASALNLLVSVDDIEAGGRVLERGLAEFPKNWKIAYAAAYFYLYEIKNIARAADLLLTAQQNGGPPWLPVLASRLYSKTDRSLLAKSVLEEYIRTNPGGEAEERARKRLKELTDGAK